MGRGLRIAFLAAALLSLLPSAAEAAKAPPTATLTPLHATRGDQPGIFDARGREVLLRGVNVNQLADYYRGNPEWATVLPLKRDDFRRIARLGFNSVRLLMSWSRLEPEPGAYDRDYVRDLKRAVRWARSYGLYVILDMHQDAWGKFIDTEPSEECAPGQVRAVGWDGAPEWATITDGLPTCTLGLRELSPAVGQAWQSFYDDREGIQTRLVELWGKLARSFAGDPAIAGYDLLNEPNPGLAPGVNDVGPLGEFYGRAIEAIREGEASRRRGSEHIVFFEPGVAWSAIGTYLTPPPSFTDDANLVFAPHIYAESISPNSIEDGFESARTAAAAYGVTVWSGEWGFFADDPEADRDKTARYGQAEDAFGYGGAWWNWKQACGDPHVVTRPGADPNPLSPSLNRFSCEPGSEPFGARLGVPKAYRDMLSRPAVRYAPGRILELSSDGERPALELRGRSPEASCGLRVFAPSRAGRPEISGRGLRRVRIKRLLGDWIVRACVEGDYELRLEARS